MTKKMKIRILILMIQIWPFLLCPVKGLLEPPFFDFRGITAEENVRDFPVVKLSRSGVDRRSKKAILK